jgi:hypothetical protein
MHATHPNCFILPDLITVKFYSTKLLFIFKYRYLTINHFTDTVTHSLHFRSLEYVGPILKALSAAYDKYAVPIIKKKD